MSNNQIQQVIEKQKRFIPEIARIIKTVAGKIISVEPAPPEMDMEKATDFQIVVEAGDIACRIRGYSAWNEHGDFTIRSVNNGYRTELHKIRDGYGDWSLCAWKHPRKHNRFYAWILVDLNQLRKSGLLDSERFDIPNGDGTCFRAYTVHELQQHHCIVDASPNVYTRFGNVIHEITF